MPTLLEFQEWLRNVSDPELEDVLGSGPNQWMAMDEKRRRAEMRKAEQAQLSEDRSKPRNMLEEYQTSSGGGIMSQEPSFGGDPYDPAMQQGDSQGLGQDSMLGGGIGQLDDGQQFGSDQVPGYAWGGKVVSAASRILPRVLMGGMMTNPVGAAIGGAALLGDLAWPFRHQIMRAVGLGSKSLAKDATGGVAKAIPAMTGRTVTGGPAGAAFRTDLPGGPLAAANLAKAEAAGRRGSRIANAKRAGGALAAYGAGAGAGGIMDIDLDALEKELQPQPQLQAPGKSVIQEPLSGDSTSDPWMEYLQQAATTNEGLRTAIENAGLSKNEKLSRMLLSFGSTLATTPGSFGAGLGAAFGAAGQAMSEITEEERKLLREAINLAQVEMQGQGIILNAIASIQKARAAANKPLLTANQYLELTQSEMDEPSGIADKLDEYRRMMGVGGQDLPDVRFDSSGQVSRRATGS